MDHLTDLEIFKPESNWKYWKTDTQRNENQDKKNPKKTDTQRNENRDKKKEFQMNNFGITNL